MAWLKLGGQTRSTRDLANNLHLRENRWLRAVTVETIAQVVEKSW